MSFRMLFKISGHREWMSETHLLKFLYYCKLTKRINVCQFKKNVFWYKFIWNP